MIPESDLRDARSAAAQMLRERGYRREADIITAGEGDDFAEVRIALALLKILTANTRRPPAAPLRPPARRFAGQEC